MRHERQPIGGIGLVWIPLACWVGVRALVAATAAIRSAARGIPFDDAVRRSALDPLNLAVVELAVFGAVLLAGLAIYARSMPPREALSIAPVRVRVVLLSVIAGLAIQFPLAELANLVQEIQPTPIADQLLARELVTPDGAFDALAIIIALVVVAPVTEELVFRGLLLPGLAERYGNAFAVGASALAFGAIHGRFSAMLYATIAGTCLGVVRIWTKSTLPAIALHAASNAVPLLLPASVVSIRGFNTVSEDVYHLPLPLFAGSTVVAVIALASIARMRPHDHRS